MKSQKKSVQLYYEYIDQFEELDADQLRLLIYAMINYDQHGEMPELDKVTSMAFSFIKRRMDYDRDKYLERCKKNKENIESYWNKKKKNSIEYNRVRMKKDDTDIEKEIEKEIGKDEEIFNYNWLEDSEGDEN